MPEVLHLVQRAECSFKISHKRYEWQLPFPLNSISTEGKVCGLGSFHYKAPRLHLCGMGMVEMGLTYLSVFSL